MRKQPLLITKDILVHVDFIRHKQQEHFVCLSLNAKHCLIAKRVVTIGLLNMSLAHPREVFAGPLTDRAAAIIVVHNHPSGDPAPSREDIKTAQQLVAAGILLGIPVHDHIIVGKSSHYSFKAHRLI
jgi:DNA repair protein RadC